MSQFWSSIVHKLTPYVPGEQPKIPNLIKLNTNENPYGPSPRVLAVLQAAITDRLRLYPDPNAEQLKAAIAAYYQLTPQHVFVGNGSDEILAHTFQALLKHPRPLLFPDITYSFYPVYCQLYGIEFETVPLNDDFTLNVEDYIRPNGGIIFPNPNAPTGRYVPVSAIETLLRANTDTVVVIDEAYIDFGGQSAVGLIANHPNLLVIQTLSKSRSLAGLRVGFALGHPMLIEALIRIKDSFNSYPLGYLAITGAVAAIEDDDYFNHTCQKIIQTRDALVRHLVDLNFTVIPSTANFIFVRHVNTDAAALALKLRERGIIVRHFRQDRIENYLRITVGTDEECNTLVAALQSILTEAGS